MKMSSLNMVIPLMFNCCDSQVKWHEICLSTPAAILEVLNAWENGVLSVEAVQVCSTLMFLPFFFSLSSGNWKILLWHFLTVSCSYDAPAVAVTSLTITYLKIFFFLVLYWLITQVSMTYSVEIDKQQCAKKLKWRPKVTSHFSVFISRSVEGSSFT